MRITTMIYSKGRAVSVKTKKYTWSDTFDAGKLILSLMVAAIHINPIGGEISVLRYPILRIAVPMFFLMSSYLFFLRVDGKNEEKRKDILKKYVLRNLKLYLSYFLLLLPVTLMVRRYFEVSLLSGFADMVRGFVFGSTWIASWFLMAQVLGVFLVFSLSPIIGDKMMLFIGFVLYIICCLASNYGNLFGNSCWIIKMRNAYPGDIYNSFPVSVFWIAVGKMFVQRQFLSNRKKLLAVTLVSIVLLYAEYFTITYLRASYANDCYIMLIPVCIFLFSLMLNIEIKVPNGKGMRTTSTVIYCVHASLGMVTAGFCKKSGINIDTQPYALLNYILVVLFCILLSAFIQKAESTKAGRWLSYLH